MTDCPPTVRRPRARVIASTVPLLITALVAPASAQHSTLMPFAPGSMSANGYTQATVEIRYGFALCEGNVQIATAVDHSSYVTGSAYWYEGVEYPVPAGVSRPRHNGVRFVGVVTSDGTQVGYVDHTTSGEWLGSGCFDAVNYQTVAPFGNFLGANSTAEARSHFRNSLRVGLASVRQHPAPLTNAAIESHIRQQLAEAERVERERQAAAAAENARVEQQAAAQGTTVTRPETTASAETAVVSRPGSAVASPAVDTREVERGHDLLSQANARYAAGDRDGARALYFQVLDGPTGWAPYKDTARRQLSAMHDEELVEASVEAAVMIGQAVAPMVEEAVDYMNEHYAGFMVGAHFQSSPFQGDGGIVGWTMGIAYRDLLPFTPYAEMGFGLGRSDPGSAMSMSFSIGSTIPKLDFYAGDIPIIGGRWSPHLAFRSVGSDDAPGDFNGNGPMFGLLRQGEGGFYRLDWMWLDGAPLFGLAAGIVFGI